MLSYRRITIAVAVAFKIDDLSALSGSCWYLPRHVCIDIVDFGKPYPV